MRYKPSSAIPYKPPPAAGNGETLIDNLRKDYQSCLAIQLEALDPKRYRRVAALHRAGDRVKARIQKAPPSKAHWFLFSLILFLSALIAFYVIASAFPGAIGGYRGVETLYIAANKSAEAPAIMRAMTETSFLNRAALEDLTKIEGIGAVLARRIIDEREKRGHFSFVEDLLSVYGIGQKKLEAIKRYIEMNP